MSIIKTVGYFILACACITTFVLLGSIGALIGMIVLATIGVSFIAALIKEYSELDSKKP